MTDRRWMSILWAAALPAAAALYAVSLVAGELNQDEGWYLYAGRLVAEGRWPYLDFASTQGPLAAVAYAAAQPLVARWGVAGGRLFTALLGLAGCGAATLLGARLAPRGARGAAALSAFVLTGLNLYQCYFTTVVKTYALAALLLTAGLAALTWARSAAAAAAAGALLGLAAGTRTSAAAAALAAGGALAWRARREPGRAAALAAFGAGLAAALAAVYLPLLWRAPRALWFGLVEYHAGRAVGGWLPALLYKAGFAARVTQAYYLPLALLAAAALWRWTGRRAPPGGPAREGADDGPVWAAALAVTLAHAAAPFPYDDYQAIVYPAAAAALGARLARGAAALGAGAAGARRLATTLLALSLAAAGSSPLLQSWLLGPRDRIWWPLRPEPPLATLRRTAALLRQRGLVEPGGLLLTQDTYLAVETGARVPAGLELGPFSYFPDWSRERAEACHVLNREGLTELLETCPAPAAAFSGYGLAIRAPQIAELEPAEQARLWGLVRARYEPVLEVPRFGQADTLLRVFRRRARPE